MERKGKGKETVEMKITSKMREIVKFTKDVPYDRMIICSPFYNLNSALRINTDKQNSHIKPYGIWYAYGTAWIDTLWRGATRWEERKRKGKKNCKWDKWCVERLNRTVRLHEVFLNCGNILHIQNKADMEKFEKKYKIKKGRKIKWKKVAKKYSGIDIRLVPEKYDDLKSEWYWHWDVSSGCIWDKSAVKDIKLLREWHK